jgi:hypothetical protein
MSDPGESRPPHDSGREEPLKGRIQPEAWDAIASFLEELARRSADRARSPADSTDIIVTASPQMIDLIDSLAVRLGVTRAEVLLRGVALLKAAVDARDQGKAVGAAGSADALETEFVGF